VNLLIAVALIAWQGTYYTAKEPSFGCTSISALHELQKIRPDPKAFRMALTEKQIYGDCVAILKGTVIEGEIEPSHDTILRVNGHSDPPGYEAPLDDFEIKARETRQRDASSK